MTGSGGPDWDGPNDLVTVTGPVVARDGYRVEDTALDGLGGPWPVEVARPRRTPLDMARGELIDAPGVVHRLTWTFVDVDAASDLAAQFAEADPSDLVPSATGYLEAVPVFDDEERSWRILARYVEPEGPLFPNFQTWMVEWLAPTVHRPLRSGVMWCPEWWRHDEAVARLDALWRAWEAARAEGGAGMAYWWDMHFDAHWAVLTSDRGPFAACKDRVHAPVGKQLDMLPCDPPPENWPWPSDEEEVRR